MKQIDEVYVIAGEKGKKLEHRRSRKRALKRRGRGSYDTDKPPSNTIVCIWSLLRQYLRQFRSINKNKLKYYVNFFEYHYNSNILSLSGEEVLRGLIVLWN